MVHLQVLPEICTQCDMYLTQITIATGTSSDEYDQAALYDVRSLICCPACGHSGESYQLAQDGIADPIGVAEVAARTLKGWRRRNDTKMKGGTP